MNTYVNILAEDVQGIVESIVADKVKDSSNDDKIEKIQKEDILSLLPILLINQLDSPLLNLQINKFENFLWSNMLNVQYKYTLTIEEILLKELIDEINQLIEYENEHPKYVEVTTFAVFADSEPYIRVLNDEFYKKLVKILRNFDLQKEVDCNPVYIASYCLVKQ